MLTIITFLQKWFSASEEEDRGATMVEYALVVAFIALVAVVGVTVFGETLRDFFSGLKI